MAKVKSWEERCRLAEAAAKEAEAERLKASRQVFELNRQLGYGDTASARITRMELAVKNALAEAAEERRRAEAADRRFNLEAIRAQELAARLAEYEAEEDAAADAEETQDLNEEAAEALTEVIRFAKKLRRGYR